MNWKGFASGKNFGCDPKDLGRIIYLEMIFVCDCNDLERVLDLDRICDHITIIWKGLSIWKGFGMGVQ